MDADSVSEVNGHYSDVTAVTTGAAEVVIAATGAAAFHALVGAIEADIDPSSGAGIRFELAESQWKKGEQLEEGASEHGSPLFKVE